MLLDTATIARHMALVPGWSLAGDALTREFKFADFKTAFAFMTATAEVAEKLGHHPEWTNIYNRVNIKLSTHDVGGLSELDFTLARAINEIANRH